jgi:hypothetical protein
MLPPIALLAEFSKVPTAYKLTHQKAVLFLPLHYVFKRVAWFLGLLNASLKGVYKGDSFEAQHLIYLKT